MKDSYKFSNQHVLFKGFFIKKLNPLSVVCVAQGVIASKTHQFLLICDLVSQTFRKVGKNDFLRYMPKCDR